MGKLPKELFSTGRFNSTVQPKGLELPLPCSKWFDPTGGNQSSDACLESKATFILAKIADALASWFLSRYILLEQS
ncbi:hypothetical protein CSQ79_26550 [Gloeocapsopsis sp. IPPAS B-1203]|nr:hypothetical protein CSQ79_26550 [Gloeocapsopsis sp. IPPAS B-1203]